MRISEILTTVGIAMTICAGVVWVHRTGGLRYVPVQQNKTGIEEGFDIKCEAKAYVGCSDGKPVMLLRNCAVGGPWMTLPINAPGLCE